LLCLIITGMRNLPSLRAFYSMISLLIDVYSTATE
jgi:hypothetical protein